MKRRQKTHEKVLHALRMADKPMTLEEWALAADLSVPTVWRYSVDLIRSGDAMKMAPVGRSRKDRFRAVTATNKTIELKAVKETAALDSKDLLQLLIAWSKQPWDPKAFKSARALPVGLAQLYGYAIEASYGAKVSKEDLDSVRSNLDEFLNDLQGLVKVLAGILKANELWNENKFVEYLLADRDPQQIQEFVHRVRELN